MTQVNHRKRQTYFHLEALLTEFAGSAMEKAEALYDSGGVDPEVYATDGRTLAKVLAIAAIRDVLETPAGLKVKSPDAQDDIENLKHF
jgi:phosphatidate phosphatase APP1